MNLLLIGYRGAGKTTVGNLLAQRMGWRFADTDAQIVEKAGKSIAEIFATEGEAGFRLRERTALQTLRKFDRQVIALGGGTATEPENHNLLRRLGKTVWLRAPAVVLWSRISKDSPNAANRPNLTPIGGLQEIEAVLAKREPVYESIADHIVDTFTMNPAQVAEAIELWHEACDSADE